MRRANLATVEELLRGEDAGDAVAGSRAGVGDSRDRPHARI